MTEDVTKCEVEKGAEAQQVAESAAPAEEEDQSAAPEAVKDSGETNTEAEAEREKEKETETEKEKEKETETEKEAETEAETETLGEEGEEKGGDKDEEAEDGEDGLPFVDVTKPNPGRIPLSSVRLEEFYTTPDRTAIAGAVEGLNHFPLKSSGTVPLALSFASNMSPAVVPVMSPATMSPVHVPTPVDMYATGVFANTAPNDPPGPQEYIGDDGAPNKGYRLFSDVFSRADKNDDGGLTFEEFRSYFDDGHVTDEELLGLFNDVDADNNGNISLLELDSYFRKGFEPYSRMFSVLAKMHSAISGGMGHSYREYPMQSPFEQFKTRFYLREFVSQMQALHTPVASALEILEHATEVRRSTASDAATPERPIAESQRIAPRKARDAPPQEYSLVDSPRGHATDPASDMLSQLQQQVARLSSVVEEIHSSRVNLRWVQHDVFDQHAPTESSYIVACRQADVTPELVYIFRDAARAYIAATQAEEGCLHVYIKQHANETKYAIYEIFVSEDALCEHNTSHHFRHFQKQIIDSLEEPLASNLMEMPTSWWGTA